MIIKNGNASEVTKGGTLGLYREQPGPCVNEQSQPINRRQTANPDLEPAEQLC